MILTCDPAASPAEGEPARRDAPPGELRCDCGSLLARAVGGYVELKCRRCKRVRWIRIEPGA